MSIGRAAPEYIIRITDDDSRPTEVGDTGNLSMRGVMVDTEDRAWFAVDYAGQIGGCGLGLVDVLTRRRKNNPILIGEAGVEEVAVPPERIAAPAEDIVMAKLTYWTGL